MNSKSKVLLVCSSGGHFLQLYALKSFWEKLPHFWVTFPGQDTHYLLKSEEVIYAFYPTNRNIKNFIKNLISAFLLFKKRKVACVISTGAGVGVPYIYVAKIFSIKTIFIESLTRIDDLSLTGKLVYHFVDYFFVQWPELTDKFKKAKFMGQVI